jgi:hypothetical protein
MVDKLWPPGLAELEFHRATGRVATLLYQLRQEGQWNEAQALFQCLERARRRWPMEWQASILDHTYAFTAGLFADWRVCEHELDAAIEYVRLGWSVLDEREQRRDQLGLMSMPSTEARLQLLAPLCDAKWRHENPDCANWVLTSKEQIESFLHCDEGVNEYSHRPPSSSRPLRNRIIQLLWTGTWVAAATLRSDFGSLDPLVSELNRWHRHLYGNDALELGSGSWKKESATARPTPWFWHFEIIKTWLAAFAATQEDQALAARSAADDLAQLYPLLEENWRRWEDWKDDPIYLEALARDRAWMQRTLRQRMFGLE